MKNFANIIVGVDLSDYSKIVVKEAQKLAKQMGKPITYVYVQDYVIYLNGFSSQVLKEDEECRQEVIQKYKLPQNTNVESRYGYPYEQIIEVAKKYKEPLIVVGYKGMGALTRYFLGSTAERLALLSPFPVWIHRGTSVVSPSKVLLPCDLSDQSAHTLDGVEPLRQAFKSKFEVFNVLPEPVPLLDRSLWSELLKYGKKENDRKVQEFKIKHPGVKVVRSRCNVSNCIEQRAKKFDVVAISPRTNSNAKHLFGSVTAKLVRSINKPVLVIP